MHEMLSGNPGLAVPFVLSDNPGLAVFFVLLFVGPTMLVQVLTVLVVGRFRPAGAFLLILASLVVNIVLYTVMKLYLPLEYGGVWVLVALWAVSIFIPWLVLPLDRLRKSD